MSEDVITFGTIRWKRLERGCRYVSTCGRYEILRGEHWTAVDNRVESLGKPRWEISYPCRSLRRAMQQANEWAKREDRITKENER